MATSTEKIFYATGRRKTSAARVFLKPGKGKLVINGLKADEYLKRLQSKMVIQQPFEIVNQIDQFDVDVTVVGVHILCVRVTVLAEAEGSGAPTPFRVCVRPAVDTARASGCPS